MKRAPTAASHLRLDYKPPVDRYGSSSLLPDILALKPKAGEKIIRLVSHFKASISALKGGEATPTNWKENGADF